MIMQCVVLMVHGAAEVDADTRELFGQLLSKLQALPASGHAMHSHVARLVPSSALAVSSYWRSKRLEEWLTP